MKVFLSSIAAILNSKSVKVGLVGILATFAAKKLGLGEADAADLANSVLAVTLALIGKFTLTDMATGGKTSHTTTTPKPE